MHRKVLSHRGRAPERNEERAEKGEEEVQLVVSGRACVHSGVNTEAGRSMCSFPLRLALPAYVSFIDRLTRPKFDFYIVAAELKSLHGRPSS